MKRIGDGWGNHAIKVKKDTYDKLIEVRNKIDRKNKYNDRASMDDAINYLFADSLTGEKQ